MTVQAKGVHIESTDKDDEGDSPRGGGAPVAEPFEDEPR
jgi:hypothetical protein